MPVVSKVVQSGSATPDADADLLEIDLTSAVTITGGNWATRVGYHPLTVSIAGSVVTLFGVLAATGTPVAYETIATLQGRSRPAIRVSAAAVDAAGASIRFDVNTTGVVQCGISAATTHVAVNMSWTV